MSDIIISSDESLAVEKPKKSRVAVKKKKRDVNILLTSDSDDDIVFKKVRKSKRTKEVISYGEISLLTSDEENVEEKPKPQGKARRKKTVELLSSDEDYVEEEPAAKKRKLPAKQKKAPGRKPKLKKENSTTVSETVTDEIVDIKMGIGKSKIIDGQTICKPFEPNTVKYEPVENSYKHPEYYKDRHTAPEYSRNNFKPLQTNKTNIKPTESKVDCEVAPLWTVFELLAEKTAIQSGIAKNIVNLLNDGNTIPFIARYRKNVVGNMSPEELRTVKEDYDEICALKKKITTVVTTVAKLGKLDENLQRNICSVKSAEELEHLYTPFKAAGAKRSLAEKAKMLGLEEPALSLMNSVKPVQLTTYVKPEIKDLQTYEDVEKNIVHIIASKIATDSELLTFLRDLRQETRFRLETKKARHIKKEEQTNNKNEKTNIANEMKFEMYFEFSQPISYMKSHQILAINRGESLKILSVKVDIPDYFENKYKQFCFRKWVHKFAHDSIRKNIFELAIADAYKRFIVNFISREIRSEQKVKAEKEACKVFSDNLKNLLLSQPLKGKPILAIDPGYSNGCKLALISETGRLLSHRVIYPHTKKSQNRGEGVIREMLIKFHCKLIGIGNGTACRETEEWIVKLIKNNFFSPLEIDYLIINEDGASIYSCSPEAKKEFGDLDPNIISAVSLARRIQDPMAELVKVEPSHLGIGMYQLDIKKKQLEEALGEVVSECVSFVGVDLNTASQCLLRRVAGLTDSKATQIILHREQKGTFTHRRQLLDVYGIGERIFEQCAGFLRVGPVDPSDMNFYKNKSTTRLDATIIHPESYHIVRNLLVKMSLNEQDIGTDYFISTFQSKFSTLNVDVLVETLKTDGETVKLIFNALSKRLNHDLRYEGSSGPLFRRDITSFEELEVGMIVTGRVSNVTSFGAFVDIGVGHNGLLHNKFMKGLNIRLGNVLEVKIIKVDNVKRHIGLEVQRVL